MNETLVLKRCTKWLSKLLNLKVWNIIPYKRIHVILVFRISSVHPVLGLKGHLLSYMRI